MNLAEFSIKRSRFVSIFLLILLLAGFFLYPKIGRLEFPNFTIHNAVITTIYPGATATEVEKYVTDKIEKKIQEIDTLDDVRSYSKNNMSVVFVDIKESVSSNLMDDIWYQMRKKINDIRPELPQNIQGPYFNDEFGDVFGIILALTGDNYSYAEKEQYLKDIRKDFLKIDSAAKVDKIGVKKRKIYIEFSNYKLSQYKLNFNNIITILRNQNIIIPSGNIKLNKEKLNIKVSGHFKTIDKLKNTKIKSFNNNSIILLKDIAEIKYDYEDEPQMLMRFNGKKALGLGITMVKSGNLITHGKKVKKVLAQVNKKLPAGLKLSIVNFQPNIVKKSVNNFIINLIESIVIVLIVLLALGLRTSILVGTGVPITILITFVFMYMFNINFQKISLASLIIALGMLVDNSVVVVELIMVKMQQGINKLDACKKAVSETYMPLLAATLIACAGFGAIPLAKTAAGEFCETLFYVVTISLLVSWILSITINPLMCYKLLKVKINNKKNNGENTDLYSKSFYINYKKILKFCVKHKFWFFLIMIFLLITSLYSFQYIPKVFFPDNNNPIITMDFWLPQGTKLEQLEHKVKQFEKDLKKFQKDKKKGIIKFASYIGSSAPRFYLGLAPKLPNQNYAQIYIELTSFKKAQKTRNFLYKYFYNNYPEINTRIEYLPNGPSTELPVEFRIYGNNFKKLRDYADKIISIIRKNPYAVDIRTNWLNKTKQIIIDVNQTKAKQNNITNYDISSTLYSITDGITITQYRESDDLIPIVIKAPENERIDLNRLENLYIISSVTGNRVPLISIANIKFKWQESKIWRRNNKRCISVGCAGLGKIPSEILNDALPEIKKIKFENGYRFEIGGLHEKSKESSEAVAKPIPLIALIVFLIMLAQFNSLRKTFIILITAVFGIIGALMGLLIFGKTFGFMTLLGILSLSGMIIKNAIVLIDKINQELNTGKSTYGCVIYSAVTRVRPILLASFTTVFGMLPLVLFGGPMWEGMAIAIMCGLSFATILTLFFVPVLFLTLFNKKNNSKKV